MPGKQRSEGAPIEQALLALRRAFDETGAPWMVIGGIAVIAHGVHRMTTDIDAVIRGDAVTVTAVLKVLRRHHIVPRVEDAEAFAERNLVILARHTPTEVDLDLSFAWTTFEHEAMKVAQLTRYGRVDAPMVGVEDLLVFKAMAARARDIDDALALLALYPATDLRRVSARLQKLADMAETPELLDGLERIQRKVKRVRRPAAPSKASGKPTRRVRKG
jgi:hypothetical protein